MKEQITEKLTFFLNNRFSLKEECELVYLMIELRKLLDRQRDLGDNSQDSLIRFYADWIVHTSKDHITSSIKIIMGKIDKILTPYPKRGDLSFLLAPELRLEMGDIFKKYSLPLNIIGDEGEWRNLIWLLTQVLSDQPLVNPYPSISEFYFSAVGKEAIMATINFKDKRGSVDLGGNISAL